MAETTLRLGPEELALTFAHLGQPNKGKAVLEHQLGTGLSQQDVAARMTSAGHALLASALMTLTGDNRVVIDPVLQRIVTALAQADFSIRYSRANDEAETFLSYHFSAGAVVEHTLEHGIVHTIMECQYADAVINGGLEFLQLRQSQPVAAPLIELPLSVLEAIDDALAGTTDAIEAIALATQHLQRAGVPDVLRQLLAEDLAGERYRGSVLRIEYDHGTALRADHGFLVLRGPQRVWLWRLITRAGIPLGVIRAGSEQAFRQEVAALLR